MFPYISWDPGEVRIGIAGWTEEGECPANIQIEKDIFFEYIKKMQKLFTEHPDKKPKVFIVEDYRVFAHKIKVHIGSRLETARVIGALEAFAKLNDIKFVLQPSSILGITQMWSGVRMPSDHSKSDKVSAYLHGYHYLHKQGIIKARVLDELNE